MKRDMELVRKVLFLIEEQTELDSSVCIEGYSSGDIGRHCSMMYEYGLIKNFSALAADIDPYYHFSANGLTWEGFDFLDKIRDEGIWQKTVKTIAKKSLDMSIKTIGTIATAFITAATEGAVSAIMKNGGEI